MYIYIYSIIYKLKYGLLDIICCEQPLPHKLTCQSSYDQSVQKKRVVEK